MPSLKYLWVASLIVLSGCTSKPPVPPPEFPELPQSDKVAINDLRPQSEKEGKNFSLLITSSAYGIYRTAEEATKPSGVRLLAHRAYETIPELQKQSSPSITVKHFVTYANLQSRLRRHSTLLTFTGPIGAIFLKPSELPVKEVVTTQIDSKQLDQLTEDEHERAFYSEQENPNKAPVNVIYIDTEIVAKRVASRCLVPPIAAKPYLYLIEAFDMCIANHLAFYKVPQQAPSN
ncbi:hypothetical protein WG219_19075 [Ectopseudomonas mendocina]|uniref:Lipoprotein n=1 Tax=Ectopseudomonas mendocina TaxID=300 RepID=A0ABZ2REC9_ECTME